MMVTSAVSEYAMQTTITWSNNIVTQVTGAAFTTTASLDGMSTQISTESSNAVLSGAENMTTVVSVPDNINLITLVGPGLMSAEQKEKIGKVDTSRPIAYTGYPSIIKRMDYSTFPPTITKAAIADLDVYWPLRATLTYT